MCYACYEESGFPEPTAETRALGIRLREVDPYGGCHIVREDWNLEDENIDFCIAYHTTTAAECVIMLALKALSEDQRAAAMAVADEYL